MKKATLKEIREFGGFANTFCTPVEVQKAQIKGFLNINHSSSEIVESAHQIIKTLSPSIDKDIYFLTLTQKKTILAMLDTIKEQMEVISHEVAVNGLCL